MCYANLGNVISFIFESPHQHMSQMLMTLLVVPNQARKMELYISINNNFSGMLWFVKLYNFFPLLHILREKFIYWFLAKKSSNNYILLAKDVYSTCVLNFIFHVWINMSQVKIAIFRWKHNLNGTFIRRYCDV